VVFVKRFMVALLCGVALFGLGIPDAQAAIMRDAGTSGGFALSSTGGANAVVMITFTAQPGATTEENGATLGTGSFPGTSSYPATFGPITLTVTTVMGNNVTFMSSTATKTLTPMGSTNGVSGGVAAFTYTLPAGQQSSMFGEIFNLGPTNSSLTDPTGDNLTLNLDTSFGPRGDFSPFAVNNGLGMPGGKHFLTLTATDLKGYDSILDAILGGTDPGEPVVGGAAYSQVAVFIPEPSSVLLLSIGLPLVGGCLCRRWRKG
jgi:hypothetical protein